MRNAYHPRRWASVLLEDRSQLPRKSGVYAVIKYRKIYYIGVSTNLNQRWRGKSHHRFLQAEQLRRPSLRYLLVPKAQARALEKVLISKYSPPWNYSKVPVPMRRQVHGWRRALGVATGLLVLFILSRSLVLGLIAITVAIALFR
ncbi:GIY-YIG nuclease family protein [Leptothoe spongobia]|uniref:GIY-YIG nuclease family protein n=1 Tax=Leptothoe spongobia TAU-MAC 1115 TaxID=1967444 RepID=A0A947GMC2_9CYAN|nr:GIY-YIG nuclease family protein [Leptothoe spongobia]MBT9317577.1 GIY-YIG nuclease family protein [Leptothoe spongobia TAU-MAC 1115]